MLSRFASAAIVWNAHRPGARSPDVETGVHHHRRGEI
jgi:hypothetical protein